MKGLFKNTSGYFLSAAIIAIAVAGFFRIGNSETPFNQAKPYNMISAEGELAALSSANAWLNTQPLTAGELKGKVVLVEFCTYTCINWLRTLPYVRAWAEKYRDKGLVVIGVHTPEFSFEKNIDNITRAIRDMKIDFPIAIDSDYNIWNAFNNQYWPAMYFIDAKGKIRHHQFGEGAYDKAERAIQQLLTEAGMKDFDRNLVIASGQGIEGEADWGNLNSQENYLGTERTENFKSSAGMNGKQNIYTIPSALKLNQWGIVGNWTREKQNIKLNNPNGRIVYRFHARDIHLVMGPAVAGSSIRFRVLIDGKPPGAAHGADTDEEGNGVIDMQRLYQLIRQPRPVSDHEFQIEFFDTGVEAFAFTFG